MRITQFLVVLMIYMDSSASAELAGPYLGQKPPGPVPEVFAPGIISLEGFHDFKGAFSPDGKEYYFCRHSLPEMCQTLFYSRVEDGVWTRPARLRIAEETHTFHPCVTSDNKYLLFYWRFDQGSSRKSGYYASARTDAGWSVPRFAGMGSYVTMDDSGSVYATEIVRGDTMEFYIDRITFSEGCFTDHERIDIKEYYGRQTHSCIAPDGSFLIFDIQDERSRMFVSFRDSAGSWGDVIDLTRHGMILGARGAYISPDGNQLFFGYEGDIWWVDIKLVEDLRPGEDPIQSNGP